MTRQFDAPAVGDVDAIMATRTSADWLACFSDDACVALVKLPAEALEDDTIRSRGWADSTAAPAPQLGADTDDVLAEAGIAPTLVQQLTRAGVVSGAQSSARAARAARLGAMLLRRSSTAPPPTA